MSQHRSTQDVFDDHLRLRRQHQVDEDIARNYAPDVILLTLDGVFHGHDGVRHTSQTLHRLLPEGQYDYTTKLVQDDYAYLEWSGKSNTARVSHGADAFVIRGGRIVAQMIHYYVEQE